MRNPLTPRKTFNRRLRACEQHLVDLEHRYSALENKYNKATAPYLFPPASKEDGSDQNC